MTTKLQTLQEEVSMPCFRSQPTETCSRQPLSRLPDFWLLVS